MPSSKAQSKTAQDVAAPLYSQPIGELQFELWETKLPWVKKYNALLLKVDISVQDCEALPRMRNDALEMHQKWAKDNQSNLTLQAIQHKFQAAVERIVSQFCEPIEARYQTIIKNLERQAPKRNDHTLFTDELLDQVVQAAVVRHNAANTPLYNPKCSARAYSKSLHPDFAARADFKKVQDGFEARYLIVLKADMKVLQGEFSALDAQQTTLQISYATQQAEIKKLTQEINTLTAQIKAKIVALAPQLPDAASSNPVSLMMAAPPPPPPPPPLPAFLAAPAFPGFKSNAVTVIKATPEQEQADPGKKASAAFVMTADFLSGIQLKPTKPRTNQSRGVAAHHRPFAPAPAASLNATNVIPKKIVAQTQQDSSSIEGFEAALDAQATKVCKRAQVVAKLQDRNRCQVDVIHQLNRKKRDLTDLQDQIISLEAERQRLSEPVIVSSEVGGMAPPPPPPPPPPFPLPFPNGGLVAQKLPSQAEKKVEQKTTGISSQKSAANTNPDAAKLRDSLKEYMEKLRLNMKQDEAEEDEEDEDTIAAEAHADFIRAQKEKAELQQRKATIARYTEAAKGKYNLDPEANEEASESNTQRARLLAEARQLRADFVVRDLTEQFTALAEQPLSVVPRPLLQPVAPQALPVAPLLLVVDEPVAPENYNHRVRLVLQENPAAMAFYEQQAEDPILHDALGNAELGNVTKAAVLDSLIICHYVIQKRIEIQNRGLSPEVVQKYRTSLDEFYTDALRIRFSGDAPKVQLKGLKDAANKYFKVDGVYIRIFADAVIMVSALSLAALVVGAAAVAGVSVMAGIGLATGSFFSQKKSAEKRDIDKITSQKVDADDPEARLLRNDLAPTIGG